jgi:hypothetical protein
MNTVLTHDKYIKAHQRVNPVWRDEDWQRKVNKESIDAFKAEFPKEYSELINSLEWVPIPDTIKNHEVFNAMGYETNYMSNPKTHKWGYSYRRVE